MQLLLTPTGKALLDDPITLWHRLCSVLVTRHTYDAAVQELALALMLDGHVASRQQAVAEIVEVMAGEHWRSADGRAPDERHVSAALVDFHWRLEVISLLQHDPGQPRWQDPWLLNQAGQTAAVEALRARAARPRTAPWEM